MTGVCDKWYGKAYRLHNNGKYKKYSNMVSNKFFIGDFDFDKRRCYIGFSSSVFFVFLGVEQIKSLNTLSCVLRMPISIRKYRHQQVTSRLSASSVIVYIGCFETVYPLDHFISYFCASSWFVIYPPFLLFGMATILF